MAFHYKGNIAARSALLAALCVSAHAAHEDTFPAQPMETVTVSARASSLTSLQAEQSLTPGGASVVDVDAQRTRQIGSLADMLRFVPGVYAASNSGTDSLFISSRGSNLDATNFDMNGVKLLQDGLPITTADGNNHNRIIDPLSAAFATVARGANGMKYGASTLGGAIDFVSATAYNSPALRAYATGGSFGQILGQVSASRVFDNGADALLTLEGKQWNGYRDHNEQDRAGVYANAGIRLADDIETRLFVNYLDNEQQLPGSLTRAEFKSDPGLASAKARGGNYRLDVETLRVANKTTWQIDTARALEFGVSYEFQDLYHPIVDRIFVDFDGPGPGDPTEVFSLLIDTDHRDVGTMLRYRHHSGAHALIFGVNYGENEVNGGNYRNLNGRRNGLTTRVDNRANTLELFAADRWQFLPHWTAVLAVQGVRAERDVRNTAVPGGAVRNPEDTYATLNPSLGFVFAPAEHIALYTNVSRIYEAPTNFELEDNLAGGNTTLNPMRGEVVEVGSRGSQDFSHASSWIWDVSMYYAWITDEILSVDDPVAPGNSLSTNTEATRHAGIEALLGARLALDPAAINRIEPLFSITFNDFSFHDDPVYGDNDLPAAPGVAVRGEILYRHAGGFYLGPTLDGVTSRFADFRNSYDIGGYTLLGIRGGWDTPHYRVFFEARNLLDKDHIATHSVRDVANANADILNPGETRSVYAGFELRF